MRPSSSRRPRYDPTSVAARKAQSQQKHAHRIKLRKQLEKARRKVGSVVGAGEGDSLALKPHPEDRAGQVLSQQHAGSVADAAVPGPDSSASSSPVVGTVGPARAPKPNPLRRALGRRKERQEAMRQAAEQRTREIKAREEARTSKIQERERLRKKLTAKTRAGQPHLFKHIDVLLERIQNSDN